MSQPEPTPDQLVSRWLAEVERVAADLPADQRAELIADLREHISIARGDLTPETEAGVRTILERLGDPAMIAAEARGESPPTATATPGTPGTPGRRSRSRTGWIVAAVIAGVVLCLASCVVAGLSLFTMRTVSGDLTGVPTPGVIAPQPSPTPPPSPGPTSSPQPPADPSPDPSPEPSPDPSLAASGSPQP